jgi:hypothetical protein
MGALGAVFLPRRALRSIFGLLSDIVSRLALFLYRSNERPLIEGRHTTFSDRTPASVTW